MRKIVLLLLVSVMSLHLAGCSSDERNTLTVTGSSTLAPVLAEIGKRFEKARAGVRVDVQTGGSSVGIADVLRHQADVGMASRSLNNNEKVGRQAHVIARDGVAFVVHKSNPIEYLTANQIHDIYTGKSTNWSDVGGHDAPITVINRSAGRSELELFKKLFEIRAADIRPILVVGENQEGILSVARNRNALIYISLGAATHEAERGVPIKLLPFKGIAPTVSNVRTGKYAFSRPLMLITRQQPSRLVQQFVEFALSAENHDLVRRFDFVPVNQ